MKIIIFFQKAFLQLHANESIRATVVDTRYKVVYVVYCGGIFCVLWWGIMLDAVDCYSSCGGVFCVLWWISSTVVVYFANCGGVLCLMWWATMLDVVVFFTYCD